MELNINGKNYELRYGLSFINRIDNIYTQSMNGVEFGMGVELLSTYLGMYRATALANAISAGTSHLDSQPSKNDIESYLENLAISDTDKFEQLFDDISEGMQHAPFLRKTLENLKSNQEDGK